MKKFFENFKIFCVKNPIWTVLISLCVITVLVSIILLVTLIPRSDLTKIEIVTPPEKTEYIEEAGKKVIPHQHFYPKNRLPNGQIFRNEGGKITSEISDEIVKGLLKFFS